FNYLLAFVLFWVFFAAWPGGLMRVVDVEPGSPLATAGVEAGDRVYTVGGRQLRTEATFVERFTSEGPVSLVLVRGADAEATRVDVTLKGAREGGTFSFEEHEVGLVEAGGQALTACWTYSAKTLQALG